MKMCALSSPLPTRAFQGQPAQWDRPNACEGAHGWRHTIHV